MVSGLLRVSHNAHLSQGVYLEYGGGGDDVADGAMHGGAVPEVVDTGGVEEDEIGVGQRDSLLSPCRGILMVAWRDGGYIPLFGLCPFGVV